MKIKIYKQSLKENHSIYFNDKTQDYLLVDGKKSDFDIDRFVFLVFNMVSDWETSLEDKSVLDGLEYKIVLTKENKEKIFHFKNKFPSDIYRLSNLIAEVCDEVKHD